jgi:hypothetical protein
VAVLAAVSLGATEARAGRRPFTWAYGTDIVPDGDVELEQWLWAKGRRGTRPGEPASGFIWWAPVFGVTDQLELAVPFQVVGNREGTHILSFDVDARYRLRPRGEKEGLQTLLRAAWHHAFLGDSLSRLDGNLILSYGSLAELHLNLDLGLQVGLPQLKAQGGAAQVQGTYDLGLALPLREGEWQVGGELFGELPFGDLSRQHHFIGPSVALTRGRVWATLGVLFGLTGLFPDTPVFMPRFMWAVVL